MQRRFSLRRVKHRITMVCSLSCSLHALFHDSSRRIFPFWKLRLRIWIVSRNDYYVSFWLIAGACSRKDQQTLNVNVDRSVFSFDNTRRWYFSIFFSLSFALSLSLSLSFSDENSKCLGRPTKFLVPLDGSAVLCVCSFVRSTIFSSYTTTRTGSERKRNEMGEGRS